MNIKANESFSAFLDGEASELDIQRMLKALDSHPEVMGKWHNLSKTQAFLQGETIVNTAMEVTSLGEIPEQKKPSSRWNFRFLQGGIAAAVALVVVTTVNFGQGDPKEMPVINVAAAPIENNVNLAQQHFEAQQRLGLYLRAHAEQASFTTGHVVVPAELEWVGGITE